MKNHMEEQRQKKQKIPVGTPETVMIDLRYQMRKMTERVRNNHRVIF